eukprot:TRINITY_DN3709_c0_g1_i1.p1 TRINITY_DN3709_c0_g1~~TRINITY_DN3709_c0_g1_i1.p1  ORF type:complete len:225 (-),score=40.94 TRINITY_DN3709_c0_g1_i1:46-720(-)
MEDDDVPTLSADTLAILNAFLLEKKGEKERNTFTPDKDDKEYVDECGEDWQLSQFWYTAETSEDIVNEIQSKTKEGAKIGCISTPSVFRHLRRKKLNESRDCYLFEFDARFECYNSQFIFYDYNHLEDLDPALKGTFDFLVVDPPFLSVECQEEVIKTVQFLSHPKTHVLWLTGAIMETFLISQTLWESDTLQSHLSRLETLSIKHQNDLSNEFGAFSNYVSQS